METHILPKALTFDDVLLQPGYAGFFRDQIEIGVKLSSNLSLGVPFISAPMDTVTESKLAIALAQIGGLGVIHRNLSVTSQVEEVQTVKKQNLVVAAAIGCSQGYLERAAALVKAQVDAIVVDSAHGYSKSVIEATTALRKHFPKLTIIAGSVATYDGAKALIKAGASALRVGMGPGAICTTRVISGMGVPQLTAILETARAAHPAKIPIIADGGIQHSGDIVKALAAGATAVMMGSFFAGTSESPGEHVRLEADHVPARFKSIIKQDQKYYLFKTYRGMGSVGAMQQGAKVSSEDEFHGKNYKDRVMVAEGVEGLVPIRGTLVSEVEQLIGGLRSGFFYVGAKNLSELWKKAQFMQITTASLRESHPHDLLVTNPGKSYH